MAWIAIAAGVLVLAALVAWVATLLIGARRARRRFRILGEVAEVSDAGRSLEETFAAICDILVPEFADLCMIDVLRDGELRRAAVAAATQGDGDTIERRLAERARSLPARMARAAGSAELAPRLFERTSDQDLRHLATDPDDLEFLRSLGMRSAITVALKARRHVTGMLSLAVAWSGRRYRREDARFAWILSGRVALALDNAGLFSDLERAERERAEIADTLQRGLLPPPLPHIPSWSLAATYRPAGAENEVGGDFYDAFRVAGGWMLVIGDVTGRGARAASITAQARYTLRTAATLTGDPLVAVSTLNRALLARGEGALCSLVAIALRESSDEPLRVAIAGHPPPLLVDGERVMEVGERGPLLGAFRDAEWTLEQCAVDRGQQLVVITDGITEAKGVDGRFGEDRVRTELAGVASPARAVLQLEDALHAFTNGVLEDDAAILALARPVDDVGGRGAVRSGPRSRRLGNTRLEGGDDPVASSPTITATQP
jgi:serine phosphatase RsbU (regulator of sigma subunit)